MLTAARYGTRDLERAKAFYDPLAEMLGASRVYDLPHMIGYKGPEGGSLLIGTPFEGEPTVGNGTQFSFAVATRDIVDAVHAKALEVGGTCEGKPGVRGPEEYGFYGAYFRDPDGNKLSVGHFAQG